MILEAGIAPEIARIARQHHGTTLMYYFYNKARENDPNVDPSLFRHNGGKPTTREAALIMLADATESEMIQIIGRKFVLYRESDREDIEHVL